MAPRRRLLALALGVSAFACGGSGEPASSDHTPPTLLSTTPADGAQVVRAADLIQLTFDEPVSRYTVQLRANGQPVQLDPGAVQSSADGKTLSVTPPRGLALPADMTLELSTVEDRNGNVMADPPRTVRWTYPAWLQMGAREAWDEWSCNALDVTTPLVHAAPGRAPYVASATFEGPPIGGGVRLEGEAGLGLNFCGLVFQEGAWTAIAAPPDLRDASAVAFEADPAGGLVACYSAGAGPARVMRWSDGAWTDLPALPEAGATECAISHRGGALELMLGHLAGAPNAYRAYRLDQHTWTPVGNALVPAFAGRVTAFTSTASQRLVWIGTGAYALADDASDWAALATPSELGSLATDVGWWNGNPVMTRPSEGPTQYPPATGTWTTLGTDPYPQGDFETLHALPGIRPLLLGRRMVIGETQADLHFQGFEWSGSAWQALGPEQQVAADGQDVSLSGDGDRVFLVKSRTVYQYNR